MIQFFKKLFSNKSNDELKNLLQNGAIILDVRTENEFKSGHVKGAVNIPLQQISNQISKIKKYNKPIVVCCASGIRSIQATGILKNKGIQAYNGGSWHKVNTLINL